MKAINQKILFIFGILSLLFSSCSHEKSSNIDSNQTKTCSFNQDSSDTDVEISQNKHSSNITNFYTVLWLNDDGSVLEIDENVEEGSYPSFDGETPTKDNTEQFTYYFSNWDKELEIVTSNQIYYACYQKIDGEINNFSLSLNEDGVSYSLVAYSGELSKLTLPDSYNNFPIISIGARAFYGKSFLTNVIMSNNIISVGQYAFSHCVNLENVSFSNSLESISHSAFSYCTSLKSLNLPGSIKNIDALSPAFPGIFDNCTSLADVVFGEGFSVIGYQMFSNCSSLKIVNFPDSVIKIGSYAFINCYALEEVNINSATCEIDNTIFYNCTSLTRINASSTNSLYASIDGVLYNKAQDKLLICPCGYKGECVVSNVTKEICPYAFALCIYVEKITTGDSVEKINKFSFFHCDNLKEIIIGKELSVIEERSFYYCNELTSISVNENNLYFSSINGVLFNKDKTTIFKYAGKNENYVIPETVESIASYCFENNIYLKTVTFSNKIKSISSYAFANCSSIVDVITNEKLSTIGEYAFLNCESIKELNFLNSLKQVGECAFQRCYALEKVTFQEGLEQICNRAFFNCESLNEITLPSTLTAIGEEAFNMCFKISNISIVGNVHFSYEEYLLINKDKKSVILCSCDENASNIVVPNSIEIIEKYAFYNRKNIASIYLPDSLKSIEEYAFYHCSNLSSIRIPENIESIGTTSFATTANSYVDVPFLNLLKNPYCSYVNNQIYIGNETNKQLVLFALIDIKSTIQLSNKCRFVTNALLNGYLYRANRYVIPQTFSSSILCFGESSDNEYFYCGNYKQWQSIIDHDHLEDEKNGTVYFYSEEQPQQAGKYWHYANNEIAIWP